jgi:aminopeptidase N
MFRPSTATDSYSSSTADASLLNPTLSSTSFYQRSIAKLSIPARLGVGVVSLGIVAGIAAGIISNTQKQQPSSSDLCVYSDYRLPSNIFIPSSYRISWNPPFTSPFIYTGNVSINLTITQNVNCILIHSGADLEYSSITYTTPTSLQPNGISYTKDVRNERIILKKPFQAGSQVTLSFSYKAPLRTNNNGLYLSTYKDDYGKTINVTATQFEATAARQAFPCFDEPNYKAIFTLSVSNVPLGYTALSNMPNTSVLFDSNTMTSQVFFQSTPKLSTYLLALVVAPLISDCGIYNGNKPICAFGVNRAGTVGKLSFARKVAELIIPFYENKFGLLLPLPKMDMVAIPDFAAGAMENMGLITYRETALLAAENISSASELQRVSVVVSHE